MQAYIHDPKSRLPRPEKELKGFDKVFLEPGETKDTVVELNRYSVGYYDTELSAWIAEAGSFDVLIGASSADIRYLSFLVFGQPFTDEFQRGKISFEVEESFTWVF